MWNDLTGEDTDIPSSRVLGMNMVTEAGASAVVRKPANSAEILGVVERLVGKGMPE